MRVISLKISEDLKSRLKHLAEKQNTSPSEIIRKAVEKHLSTHSAAAKGSFLDLAEDIIGSAEGPEDLSTSKKYSKGYGKR
ncbi:ribbon-helix-helix domain-containing protein [bacterium]|nr:ribbon-helix-helix domain-containing protein [bacterium]